MTSEVEQRRGPAGPRQSRIRGDVDRGRLSDPGRLAAVRSSGLLDTPAEAVLDEMAAAASRLTGTPLAFVTLVDERRSYWKASVGTGIPAEDTTSRQNTVDESFCQYVIATDGPVVVTDAATDELTADNPSVGTMGVRAWAGYPVRSADGHVLGSFCVVDTAPREFSDDDLLLLSTLAAAASREVALRAALVRAHDEVQQQGERSPRGGWPGAHVAPALRRLQALNAAALAMQQLDQVQAVLQVCTEHAAGIVGARQAVSSVTGADRAQAITAVVLDDAYDAWSGRAVPPDGSGIHALVCETNTAVRMSQAELEAHPRWRGYGPHVVDHPPPRGWLAAPLVARDGSNLGLIQLSDKRGGAEFSDEDLAVLVQLAQLASLSLEKALSQQRDREIAVELQRSLLPPSLPDLPGVRARARYLPGGAEMMVGGDWYDVFALRGGWVGLALGDVVGHGLRSASVMGQLRTALRAYAVQEESPAVVVDRLDRLVENLGTSDMATLAYGAWHPPSGTLRLVLAGHPAPHVRSADGSVLAVQVEPGLPLGAFPGCGYCETTVVLPPGAVLVLFSDGLLETRVRSVGEGLAQLLPVLASADPDLDVLLDHVIAAMTGGRNDDDIAVLAVSAHHAGDPCPEPGRGRSADRPGDA